MVRRFLTTFVLLLGAIAPITSALADSCIQLNSPTLADDSLTVTMKSITVIEKSGSTQLTIMYRLNNNTSDKKLDEGQFKVFYTDGSSEPQYGFFGSLFLVTLKSVRTLGSFLRISKSAQFHIMQDFFHKKLI